MILSILFPKSQGKVCVSPEELLGETNATTRKRGPAPKLAQQMERISQLPKPQQRFVIQVLESVLAQAASR